MFSLEKSRERLKEYRVGRGNGAVTVSSASPTEHWLSLKSYSIFYAERGAAPRPIGQLAMDDIRAMFDSAIWNMSV